MNASESLENRAFLTVAVSVYLTADHEASLISGSHLRSDERHGRHLYSDLTVRQHLGEFKANVL